MAIQIKLKNSVVQDSTPSTSDLPAVGEIALNANINSIGGFMRASDNTIVKIFGPGSLSTPTATTTVSGISELATNSETTTGTATNRVVTPAGLNAVTVAERTTSNTNYVAKAGSTLTGVLTMPNGSNSAPAINFGDSDSGIFGGTNTVSLTAGGTTRLTADTGVSVVGTLAVQGALTTTQNLTIAEKVIHSGDTDTFVSFPAANTVSVENGGSESLRVTSQNRVLIGTSSSRLVGNAVDALLQIEGMDQRAKITLVGNGANTSGSFINLAKSRSTSIGGTTAVQDGDILGQLIFAGADGTDLISKAANIKAEVDGTPGSNDMPGRLVFGTTADGADSPTTRLTIDSAGLVKIPDNGKFVAGAGSDLQISHDSSIGQNILQASAITRFRTNSLFSFQNSDGSEAILKGTPDAAVELFFNGSKKLETSNTGVSVTGAITGTGDMTIDTNTLHVDSSNNRVGIGTTSPVNSLHLNSDDATFLITNSAGVNQFDAGIIRFQEVTGNMQGAFIQYDGSGNKLYLGGHNTQDTDTANDRKDLTIDRATGNVGIGTTSPARQLEVNSDSANTFIRIRSSDTGNAGFEFGDQSDTVQGAIFQNSSDNSLRFNGFNNAERMRIDSSGNVGIGTTTPDAPLVVRNASAAHTVFKVNSQSESTKFTVQTVQDSDIRVGTQSNHPLAVYVNQLERVRVDTSGNVGIGTTNPDTPLTISRSDTGSVIRGLSTGNNTRAQLDLTGKDPSGNAVTMRVGGDGDFGGMLFTFTNHKLGFATNNASPQMILDTSGRLLIGLNSSAANASIDDLQVGNPNSSTQTGITIGSNDEAAIAFANNGDARAGSITYNMGADAMIFKTDGQNERMRLDNSGKVGIGTTNPAAKLSVVDDSGITIEATTNATPGKLTIIGKNNSGQVSAITRIESVPESSSNAATTTTFNNRDSSNNVNEHMRINSAGNVGIGLTAPNDKLHVLGPVTFRNTSTNIGSSQMFFDNNESSGAYRIRFDADNDIRGSITVNSSGVTYNTSSDYRLKENITAITDGITRLKTLKPSRFNWKSDSSKTVDGFIAHEVTAVPEAITGTKDAVATEDSKDYKKGDPIYQQIDQSKLVPLLVAAVQELIGKVEALEAA